MKKIDRMDEITGVQIVKEYCDQLEKQGIKNTKILDIFNEYLNCFPCCIVENIHTILRLFTKNPYWFTVATIDQLYKSDQVDRTTREKLIKEMIRAIYCLSNGYNIYMNVSDYEKNPMSILDYWFYTFGATLGTTQILEPDEEINKVINEISMFWKRNLLSFQSSKKTTDTLIIETREKLNKLIDRFNFKQSLVNTNYVQSICRGSRIDLTHIDYVDTSDDILSTFIHNIFPVYNLSHKKWMQDKKSMPMNGIIITANSEYENVNGSWAHLFQPIKWKDHFYDELNVNDEITKIIVIN